MFNKHSDSTIINEHIITTAKEEIREFIIKNDFDTQKIHNLLLSQGYGEERVAFFLSIIENNKEKLLYLTLMHLNSKYGETVTKFDWVLKLVYGTSELKKLKYPLVQLALTTVSDGEYQQKQYDLNKDMLIKLINVLDSITLQ